MEIDDEHISARKDFLPWDDYFMAIAQLSAKRSKDPNTQVGACIVDEYNRIVAVGYNGLPNGFDDSQISWARTSSTPLNTKYPYIVHAEANAILNKNAIDLRSCRCRIYTVLFPCNECAKLIVQSGIREVIYMNNMYANEWQFVSSQTILNNSSIQIRQFTPKNKITIFDS
jgi:dCMP deaminase